MEPFYSFGDRVLSILMAKNECLIIIFLRQRKDIYYIAQPLHA
jgi:hypothetical protein